MKVIYEVLKYRYNLQGVSPWKNRGLSEIYFILKNPGILIEFY